MSSRVCKIIKKKKRLTLQILKLRLLFSQMNTDSGAVGRPPLLADMQRNIIMMAFDPAKEGNIGREIN